MSKTERKGDNGLKKAFIYFLLTVCAISFAQSPVTNSILIQAEDFTSYVDTSPGNYDLIYRSDVDVDMNYDHDPYWYEGIRVMAIQTDEELTYTIEVPVTDTWDITFNGIINFDLYFDGSLYADGLGTPLDFRGDFRYNQDIIVPGVPLTAGTHTMTIISNSQNDFGDVQLDYIWFASTTDPPAPLSIAPKPYDDTVPPSPPPGYISPVSMYGQLYVDGPDIKSSVTGEKVRLRFAAISSSKWFPTIKNNTIYNLAYHENVHGIRLAMYAEYGTYDDPYLRPYLQEKTLEVINECIDAGLYLEISYHTHAADFQIGGAAYALEMEFYNWLLAQPVVAAGPPNLIFGIINEIASSSLSWETAKPYAQDFVDLIRATHPANIILCGTPCWSQNPHEVIGNELAGSNLMYTFHMYTAEHQLSIADNVIACYDAGIPVWANEISPGHYDWQEWSYDFDHFTRLINILETRGIPWTNWAWTIKGEALSALYWDSRYYGPWKNSELTEGGRFIRNMINDYLVYTDFSDGADGWYLNDWEEPAADVEYNNEEAHIIHNGIASPHFFGQQFSLEHIRIVHGITYTVSFDARSAAPRDIQVDVSESNGDYTVYSTSETLGITTAMARYTFGFTMNDATDPDARIVFNVGASTDDIWLDNIAMQYSELEAPEAEKDDAVVLEENFNGEIDWGFNPWQPSWPSAEIEYADSQAHITYLALAEDPWGQQLSKGIELEQGASYIVSFDARSTAPRPLNAAVLNSVTYNTYGAGAFTLSTNTRTYSFRFTLEHEATEHDIIQFNLGTDTHELWLDNIRIVKYNRLLNGDFSLEGSYWSFNPWQPSWPSAEIEYTGNEAHITFLELAPDDYGQQLFNSLKLETGESYVVSFDARAAAARPLKVLITNNTYYYPFDFVLSPAMEHYECSFIMEADASENDIIRFDMGTDTSELWLDNVVVRKKENLLTNGYFQVDDEPWSAGFYEGAAGTADVAGGEIVVDIAWGGTESWHVQFLQTGVEINRGRRYEVTFDARAGLARDIEVNIGSGAYSNPDPYTSYSGAHLFHLDTEMQAFSFEFTMNQPDHDDARCEFNLGLSDSDVILDNVRIIELATISDDFDLEDDPGNWQSNGDNCFWNQLYLKDSTLQGMDIQSTDGALELMNGFDASDADAIKITFTYYTTGYKDVVNYGWDLLFSNDNGTTWNTVFAWADKALRGVLVDESVILHAANYHFSENCSFKFQSNGKNKNDDVYIDTVDISVYR
ncbi:MAG: carbohydrate binding domain-containing protein [Spirochaetales bacterium]|nr:carbohydrate binding domain-containing protein [Spirochaetales bacterium]